MRNPQTQQLGLEALYTRRADFHEQIERMTSLRGQLADQIAHTDGSLRAEPQARLAALDARIARIEKEALATEDRISALLEKGVVGSDPAIAHSSPAHLPPPPPRPPTVIEIPVPGPAYMDWRILGLEAAGFLLLTAILCRWTWQRAKKRFSLRPLAGENMQLQQAVDAIALEVERISEGQRFVTTLLNQRHLDRDPRSSPAPAVPRGRSLTPV